MSRRKQNVYYVPMWNWKRLALYGMLLAVPVAPVSASPNAAPNGLTLDGHALPSLGSSRDLVVLLFVASDCPISNRYLPEIKALTHRFAGQPVRFWLVFPNPGESGVRLKNHLAAFGQNLPALLDPAQHLVALAGAKVTPEAILFLPGLKEAYRGRIDDRYISFGHQKPQATHHDLEDAIAAALAGKPVLSSATASHPVGCSIVPLR